MAILILDKNKKEWTKITKEEKSKLSDEEKEKTLSLPDKLIDKLEFGISQQAKNNDVVGIISGAEGSGKSSLAGNIMRYVSKDSWNPKKHMIGSDYEQGLEVIKNIKKGGFITFDEGNVFFLSTEMMKRESRELHKIFSIFRQKCLFVLIILPSFLRLNSYFALDRSGFLIRTYIKNGERGQFAYYGRRKKDKLYRVGKKSHNENAVTPNFRARFNRCYLLETEDYKNFKLETLNKSFEVAKPKKLMPPKEIEKKLIENMIRNNIDKPTKYLSEVLPIGIRRIEQIRKAINEEQFLK